MSKALIISDNISMTCAMENEFSLAGWSSDSISVSSMMLRGIASKRDLQCVALVVDKDFRKRIGSVIEEMSNMISSCSKLSPLYLMFEGDYDSSFASWLYHTKRLFKQTMHQRNLQEAIHEVIRLESEEAIGVALESPMDSL
jgi:hypothetical protein